MRCFKNIIFITILFVNTNFSQEVKYTFKGHVFDSDDRESLFADVVVKGSTLGASTDSTGMFIIKDIPKGKHIIIVGSIAFQTIIDTIKFEGNETIVEKDYYLPFYLIGYELKINKEIEDYHIDVKNTSKGKEIIEIKIDSISFNEEEEVISTRIYNNSDYPVYILKQTHCNMPFKLIVKDSKDKLIEPNLNCLLCCDNLSENKIDTSDMVKILPNNYLDYSNLSFLFYDFDILPKDTYSIKLVYTYTKPNNIGVLYKDKDENIEEKYASQIKAQLTLLRGKFLSNELILKN